MTAFFIWLYWLYQTDTGKEEGGKVNALGMPLMLSSLLETLSYGIPFVKNVDPTGQFLNDSERVPC